MRGGDGTGQGAGRGIGGIDEENDQGQGQGTVGEIGTETTIALDGVTREVVTGNQEESDTTDLASGIQTKSARGPVPGTDIDIADGGVDRRTRCRPAQRYPNSHSHTKQCTTGGPILP